jgi:nitrite reductase/ring-hydroxylating ferredoxin subunit
MGGAKSSLGYEKDDRLIVYYGDRSYELPARCPHLGGPLIDGYLNGPFLRCAWHGATFDIRTGVRLRGPDCPNLDVREGDD